MAEEHHGKKASKYSYRPLSRLVYSVSALCRYAWRLKTNASGDFYLRSYLLSKLQTKIILFPCQQLRPANLLTIHGALFQSTF